MDIKVNEVNQTPKAAAAPEAKAADDRFRFTLTSVLEEGELKDKLTGLIKDIEEQGDKIARHMDIRDMKTYRSMIKEFLNEIVTHSHEFSRENFLDRRGRHRVYGRSCRCSAPPAQ